MGTVTAIVSAYHAIKYLEGRIDNLLSQNPIPQVVVVAQAGSMECSIAGDWPVTLLQTAGIPTIYQAWNEAIKEARNDYIVVANSDDRFYPGALEVLADDLDANPHFALCYADCDVVHSIGGDPVNRYQWAEGGFEELLEVCFVGPMPMWRRSLHYTYGYFDEAMKSAGDYEFWLRITKQGERLHHIKRSVGAYLARRDSAERREPLRTIWETARARSRYAIAL